MEQAAAGNITREAGRGRRDAGPGDAVVEFGEHRAGIAAGFGKGRGQRGGMRRGPDRVGRAVLQRRQKPLRMIDRQCGQRRPRVSVGLERRRRPLQRENGGPQGLAHRRASSRAASGA